MQVFVFVDYDNIKPLRKEIDEADTEQNLIQISSRAAEIARDRFSKSSEVVLRLYDGWLDVNGDLTDRAIRLLRAVRRLPRRLHGYRINPEMAKSPFFCAHDLRGLVRGGAQKMVDSLVVADLTWFALSTECPLIVMSDDDDMIPGILSALTRVQTQHGRRPVCLARQRPGGEGLNDHVLTRLGICYEGAA